MNNDKQPWTPGPWRVCPGPEFVGGGRDTCIFAGEEWVANMDHREPKCEDIHVTAPHNEDACPICSIDAGEITREQAANARLIAEAPAMASLLERLLLLYTNAASADVETEGEAIISEAEVLLTRIYDGN